MLQDEEQQLTGFWCLWGAALAGVPFVMRSDLFFLYQFNAPIIPFQFCMPAVAGALLLSLYDFRMLKLFQSLPKTFWLACGAVSLLLVFLMELAWLPMTFGSDLFLDCRVTFDILGAVGQMISLFFWQGLGVIIASDNDRQIHAFNTSRSYMVAFLLAAAIPVTLLLLNIFLSPSFLGGLIECIFVAIAALHGLKRLFGMSPSASEMTNLLLSIFCGLLVSAVAREAISSFYISSYDLEFNLVASAFFSALAIIALSLLLLLAAFVRRTLIDHRFVSIDEGGCSDAFCLDGLPNAESLSPKEEETLRRLLYGETITSIANSAMVRTATVSTYRSRGLAKLGFSSIDALRDAVKSARNGQEANRAPLLFRLSPFAIADFASIVLLGIAFSFRPAFQLSVFHLLLLGTALLCVGLGLWIAGEDAIETRFSFARTMEYQFLLACCGLLLYHTMRGDGTYWPCVIALYAIGAVRDCFLYNSEGRDVGADYAPLSSRRLLSLGCYCIIASISQFLLEPLKLDAACCLASLCLLAFDLVKAAYEVRRSPSLLDASKEQEKRALEYLHGRGLNETEAQVALYTALGHERSYIARNMSIAVGTVNSCRAIAYKRLEVHSASELRTLLDKHTGLSGV